jgi:chemotaxis protein histidine kinase CheA
MRSAVTGTPLLDSEVLDELIAQIGEGPLRAVVDLFLVETREYVAQIGDCAVSADGSSDDDERRDRARRAAHSLKSSAGQVGAAALAEAARRVEEMAAEERADFTAEAVALARCARETEAVLVARLHR